jgi:hypothetical protein
MDDQELERRIEGIGRINPESYRNFQNYGEKAIYLLEQGAEGAPRFADTTEILEAAGDSSPKFTSIINMLSRAEILNTWNDSSPFRVATEDYGHEDVVRAYEHVTGEEYDPERFAEPERSPGPYADPVLDAVTDYED